MPITIHTSTKKQNLPQRSIQERNAITERYFALAEKMAARRFVSTPPSVEYDDLLSAACQGLLDAATRYDESKINCQAKDPFMNYAMRRIHGSMNDYLRSCNWGTRNKPRFPISIDAASSSFDNGDDGASMADDLVSKERPAEHMSNRSEFFEKVTRCLPERDRAIFRWRFVQGLTMREVSVMAKVSESRVSQVLADSAMYLRRVWKDKDSDLWYEATISKHKMVKK